MLMTGSPISLLSFPLTFIGLALEPPSSAETAELEFLRCLEESAKALEDTRIVEIRISQEKFDSFTVTYLDQRLDELLYPRLRISDNGNDAVMQVKYESESRTEVAEMSLLDEARCRDVVIEIWGNR